MKKQLLLTALLFTTQMMHPMQEQEPLKTEIKFNDHILLPDGHMRAIYDPLCKRMWLVTFGADGRSRTSYGQEPFEFINPKTNVVENVEFNQICGIAQFKHYIFYAAVGSLRDEKIVQIVGRQNMLNNHTTHQWTYEPDPSFNPISIDSLIVSKEYLLAKTTSIDKKNEKLVKNVLTRLNKEHFMQD